MAFDEKTRARVAAALRRDKHITEKRMFGGVAFMHKNAMALGVIDKDLMVRVGPDAYQAALSRAHVRPMDFTGKPLKGFVYVAPAGFRTSATLRGWIDKGLAGAKSPKKTAAKSSASKKTSKTAAKKSTARKATSAARDSSRKPAPAPVSKKASKKSSKKSSKKARRGTRPGGSKKAGRA